MANNNEDINTYIEYKKDIPMVPEEFINKEPCLNDLKQFIEEYSSILNENPDLKLGVNGYIKDTTESCLKGKYYLLGQLPLLPSEPITNKILYEAIEVEERKREEYGGPCHQAEVWGLEKHSKWFTSIKNLITVYYDIKMEEYYEPGKGEGYMKAKESFEKRQMS